MTDYAECDLWVGKAPGGQLTHYADPQDLTRSLCGRANGSLRVEAESTHALCKLCRRKVIA